MLYWFLGAKGTTCCYLFAINYTMCDTANACDDKPRWFAMSAPYRNEMKAKQLLDDKGVDNFIPLCSKIIVGRDGRKKRKVVPIVSNLLFAYTTRSNLQQIKSKAPFLQYRTHRVNGRNEPIVVPQKDMEQFMAVCNTTGEQLIYFSPEEINLAQGTPVRVVGGAFDGVEGIFLKVKGARSKRVVVQIEGIAVATAEIQPQYIQVIDTRIEK